MSTLETSVVFSAILLVLTGLIVLPARLCADTVEDINVAIADICYSDQEALSPERINTFLSGISDNYRIIYGTISGGLQDEGE